MILANQIHAAPYNPRTITDKEKMGLSNSISEFGDLSGITWNKRSGNLIAGHQRWAELLTKGEVTLHFISGDRHEILIDGIRSGFYFREVDWDEHKEMAANLAANNHAISGKFEIESLSTVIDTLKDFTPDMLPKLNLDILMKDLTLDFNAELKNEPEEKPAKENDEIECPSCGFRIIE